MRSLLLLLAATTALAQPPRQTQVVTTEDFRGVSAVSAQIAWASGTHGTYLRTTDGHTWIPGQVPNANNLDFRGVVAFSADEAFLMSAGSGDQSRIYHTSDAGQHWQLQVTASNSKSFFDAIAFWDQTHGIVLGDPIADDHGQLKFQLLITDDGQTWTPIDPSQLPPAIDGEGAFAASNSCLAILPSMRTSTHSSPHLWKSGASAPPQPQEKEGALAPEALDPHVWFATGGKAARVFYSPDRGHTWQVFNSPIAHGPDSAGIFSITFRDPNHGIVAGGDYKHPNREGPNLAFTNDGGKTWTLSKIYPQSYYSAVAYDRTCCPPENSATAASRLDDNQAQVRLFITAPDFIYDFRPPRDPTRISPPKKSRIHFNAVSPYPAGGALFVGPKGSIATIP
jgi:photosystem II stability/assembly factor-like uncharacterized protein